MAGRVSVLNSRELKATVFAIKALPRELRREIRQHTKAVAAREWTRAIQSEADTVQETRVIAKTAKVSVSDQNIRVRAAGSRRKVLSGGLIPVEHHAPVEFGSRRHTQFRRPNRSGYVFYPAAAEMIPRILSLWVQTTFRTVAEALEGKRGG